MRARPATCGVVAAVALAVPAAPQADRRELETLRTHLELPAEVKLKAADVVALPPSRPLRVRLVFGLDLKARENVTHWIAEWNRKDGARLGTLQVVDDGAADVVLARYTNRDKVRTRTVTGPDLGPSGPGTTSRSSTRSRFELDTIPVYAYVIDSRAAAQWSIVWRHTGFTTLDETGGSGREAWDGLRELLKKRKAR